MYDIYSLLVQRWLHNFNGAILINVKSWIRGRNIAVQRPNFRVSVITVNEKQEILLVQHKKGTRYYWVLPGGRIEYGEDFATCAVR